MKTAEVSHHRSAAPLLTLLALVVGGCRNSAVRASDTLLYLDPDRLEFGSTWADGTAVEQQLRIVNDSRAAVDLTWELPGDPFEVVGAPGQAAPGETVLTVRFSTLTAGRYSRRFSVLAAGGARLEGAVEAAAMVIPVCEPSSPCVEAAFVKDKDRCQETPFPDGTACDPKSLCVENASCQAGRCTGTEKRCADGNRCTVDVCNAETGCEFLPSPPCPGDGQCQVGVCSPATGCGLAPADDGLSCGAGQSCVTAEVCIAGQCVSRHPPAGFVCAEASPCEGEGRCVADQCVRAGTKSTLVPSWTFDSLTTGDPDAGVAPTSYSDLVLEETGAMSLGNFFQAPVRLRANTQGALMAPDGAARRCIVWNDRLVCADYPNVSGGKVTALDPATGATLWSFDVHAGRPDFVDLTSQIFLARLVVQGSDRLAALYEAYPPSSPPNPGTLCRRYFLIVLDGRGRLVQGQQVTDPMLDVCNHPHPYGVVADVVGNLFIAFSPSKNPQAPLIPDKPMLLISYTHDGVFRWKLNDPTMNGGELAVARGLLYPENSDIVLSAATGRAAFVLPEVMGRVVVADARLITSPQANGTTLAGYEAGTATRRWTHALPQDARFWSEQLRLASWHTSRGERTVALTFVEQNDPSGLMTTHALRAVDAREGSEAFTCPVDLGATRTGPQLFEVADGTVAIMEGAVNGAGQPGCSKCDPPFSGTAGRFHSLPLPGISGAREPWLGTFGGPGHDHQEELLPWAGSASPSN